MAFQTIFHKNTGKSGSVPGGQRDWYRLDLSATVYPTLQRRNFSSVYRLSVLLKEPIRPNILQKAADIALKRFPTYRVAIHKGLFWRYLEPNSRPGPFVQPDIANPCMPMYFKAGNRYLLRIYYYDRRISLECHHCLGDGTGGMCVLQTITAVYLRLLGNQISNGYFVLDVNETPDPEELEDAYMRYANARVCPPRPAEKTYRVRGTPEPFHTLNIIDGIMSVSQVNDAAKKYGADHHGISQFRPAVRAPEPAASGTPHPPVPGADRLARKPEALFSLRGRCAISSPWSIRPSIPGWGTTALKRSLCRCAILCAIISMKNFCAAISPPTRPPGAIPSSVWSLLFLKDIVVRTFYRRVQDKNSSAGLTNMGALKVPEDMKPYIERFDIYMGQPFSSRTNCAVVSFEDTLTVNFASCIVEADVERLFFRKLVEDGIQVKIESNRSFHEE